MIERRRHHLALVAALVAAVGVLSSGAALGAPNSSGPGRRVSALADETVVVGAVGDIACENDPGTNPRVCQYDDVGTLAQSAGLDAFLPLGDVQYEEGELAAFQAYYDPWFGPLKPITDPVPGNHEYFAPNTEAQGYFSYFGSAAGSPGAGYYSLDLGAWHIIALNSELCYPSTTSQCKAGGAQYTWLQNDLASHPNTTNACTIAYFHRPRFSLMSAGMKSDANLLPIWRLLYQARADIVLSSHAHSYQRWKPMNPDGAVDTSRGIRQFVVGTGGRSFHALPKSISSEVERAQAKAFGILKLVLKPGTYNYRWLSAPGQPTWRDRGRGVPCV